MLISTGVLRHEVKNFSKKATLRFLKNYPATRLLKWVNKICKYEMTNNTVTICPLFSADMPYSTSENHAVIISSHEFSQKLYHI